MAKRSSKPSRSTPQGTADDAFTARVLEFTMWARQRTEVVVIAVVAVVLLVVGGLYWMNQRSARLDQAALELETIQQAVFFAEPDQARSQIQGFVDRFGGTPFAVEARMLLAELELEEGNVEAAIAALEPVAPSNRTPLRMQATFLLATAYEEAARWDDAATTYQELVSAADLSFQRREATEGLVRAHLELGDTAAAVRAYDHLLELLEEDHPRRGYYEMRRAELGAMP